jgi:hypothetical protein
MRTCIATVGLLLISCDGDMGEEPEEVDPGSVLVIEWVDKGEELPPEECPEGSEILLAEDLGGGTVEVVHACAWMNLCTQLGVTMIYAHPVVELHEHDTGEPCYGEGRFSPTFRMSGFEPGTYEFELGGFGVTGVVE